MHKTRDGSITFFNKQYNEHYHSITGALEEAFEKFVKPAQIKDGFRILDFCFGLGYNSYAAITLAKNLEIIGLENDREILQKIQGINIDEKYEIIKKAAKYSEYADKDNSIKLIIGDAQKTIKNLKGPFNVVFFDPFSPKSQPEMWSLEIFQNLAKIMKKGGVLTTYSCANKVRKNMQTAGFSTKDGPCIGRRSPSTIAIYK